MLLQFVSCCCITTNIISIYIIMKSSSYLPPAMKLGQGYVFIRVCNSVHGGWCPSMHRSRSPVGGWYPIMTCKSPGPHPGGKLRGLVGGEVSRSPGPHPGGVSRPTLEGSLVPHLGNLQAHTRVEWYPSMH